MLAAERQKIILSKLKESGAVQSSDLQKLLQVTGETLRKDMIALENKGLLRRMHGGAVELHETVTEKRLFERKGENEELKKELARYAVALVKENDVIAVESGTTGDEFARELCKRFKQLTVVTNSIEIPNILAANEGIKVIVTGGEALVGEESLYGQFALETLEKLHVSKAFICPVAISIEFGVSNSRTELYPIANAMIKMADRVIFLADSTKFDKNACFKTCALSPECTIVTDSRLSAEKKRIYEKTGARIICGQTEE